MQGGSSNAYPTLKRWVTQAATIEPAGLQALQEEDKRLRGKPLIISSLNGLKSLSPQLAQFCAQYDRGLFNLDGLQSVDPQILSILMNGPATLSLNGLPTISMEQAKIIALRTSQSKPNLVHLKGLTHIKDDVLKVLSALPYVTLPKWTLLHEFPPRLLKSKRYLPFEVFSPEQFAQLDLTKQESIPECKHCL